MQKFFNTAGPTKKDINYHIDLLSRVDWDEIQGLIDQQRYFILHAPRQTGKTSTLLGMMEELNSGDTYACSYANIEAAQAARGDVTRGVEAICSATARQIDMYLGTELTQWLHTEAKNISVEDKFSSLLKHWSQTSAKPVILLLDEVDALIGDTLISLLRQIRAGYAARPEAFPHSIILCGVRDIKDYRIHTKDQEIITGGSAFNIKAESIKMGNFSYDECKELWGQHTEATGQTFEESIWDKLWSDTKGQPWLVNALAHQLTWKNKLLRKDRSISITFNHYMIAREELIQSRATHLDQLTDKLREERVYNVISSIIGNSEFEIIKTIKPDDQQYVEDLGLIVSKPNVHISNDIYKEIIPRELTWIVQTNIPNQEQAWYINKDNTINTKKLLLAFQAFFRKNADSWLQQFQYKEAGPQLLLQAFLQRIINGGGRIHREYALGRGRTDIFIEWPTSEQGFFGAMQHIVIETKILYANLDETIKQGIEQTKEYMDKVNASEGVLIVFDRSSSKEWDEKVWDKEQNGLLVLGC